MSFSHEKLIGNKVKLSRKRINLMIERFLIESDKNYGAEDHEVFIEPEGITFKYPDGEEEVLELGQFDDETSSYEVLKQMMSDNGIDDIDGDLDQNAFENLMQLLDGGADQLLTQDSFEKFGSNEDISQMMADFAGDNYGEFYDEDRKFVNKAKKLEKLKKLNLPPGQQKPYRS